MPVRNRLGPPILGTQMRSPFESFLDRAFWSLLLGVASFGVKFLHDLSQSVDQLNQRMVAVVNQVQNQSADQQDQREVYNLLASRVEFLERINEIYPNRNSGTYRSRKR